MAFKTQAAAQIKVLAQPALAAPELWSLLLLHQLIPPEPLCGQAPSPAAAGVISEIKALCWQQQSFKKIIFSESEVQ